MSREFNREAERKICLAESIAERNYMTTKNQKTLGLFNYTPHSVGDDSYYNKNFPKRDENNNAKIWTKPRQCYPGGTKGGKDCNSYFGYYHTEGTVDTYVEPHHVQKILAKKTERKGLRVKHEAHFKNGNGVRLQKVTSYEHLQDYDTKRVFPKRNNMNKPVTGPLNMLCQPPRKGHFSQTGTHFNAQAEFMKEPYDRRHKLFLANKKRQKAKGFKHEAAWRPKDPGNKKAFSNNEQTYNFDLTKFPKKKLKDYSKMWVKQDDKFRTGMRLKSWKYATIGKIAEYKGDPLTSLKRKPKPTEIKEPYKQGFPNITWKPSPSVSTNPRNLFRSTMRSTMRSMSKR